jgi:colanic acid biosynthesis glycosyl transferase WcaI
MKKKSVLLICQYFPPDITAAAFRIGSLTDFLQQNHFRVSVLTSYPWKTQKFGTADGPKNENLRVMRVKAKSKRYVVQYFKFLCYGLLKLLPFILKNPVDVVIASSPPLSVFVLGYLVSRLKGVPLITDIRDLWPDTPLALGKLRDGSIFYRFFKRYEKWMYRHSHWLTCVSRPMQQEIQKLVKESRRVSVVYNGIEGTELEKAKHTPPPILPMGKKRKFRVFYYGNIGLAQGLDILLSVSRKVEESIEFYLVGAGAFKKKFMQDIQDRRISNVTILDALPREKLYSMVEEQADILFVNLLDRPVFHFTIPSKLFDYLLHRLPVICGIQGEGRQILSRTGSGVFFEAHREESLLSAINFTVKHYPDLLAAARKNNLSVAADFVKEKNFEVFLKIIEEEF